MAGILLTRATSPALLIASFEDNWCQGGIHRRGAESWESLRKIKSGELGPESYASGAPGTVDVGGERQMPPISMKFILYKDGREASEAQNWGVPAQGQWESPQEVEP